MIKITITAIIQAPIKDVYDSYLNAEDNRRWNTAGNDWTTGETTINAVVNGRWQTEYISPDRKSDFIFGGTYTEILPYQKVAYAMNQMKMLLNFKKKGGKQSLIILRVLLRKKPIQYLHLVFYLLRFRQLLRKYGILFLARKTILNGLKHSKKLITMREIWS